MIKQKFLKNASGKLNPALKALTRNEKLSKAICKSLSKSFVFFQYVNLSKPVPVSAHIQICFLFVGTIYAHWNYLIFLMFTCAEKNSKSQTMIDKQMILVNDLIYYLIFITYVPLVILRVLPVFQFKLLDFLFDTKCKLVYTDGTQMAKNFRSFTLGVFKRAVEGVLIRKPLVKGLEISSLLATVSNNGAVNKLNVTELGLSLESRPPTMQPKVEFFYI